MVFIEKQKQNKMDKDEFDKENLYNNQLNKFTYN